MSFGNLLRTERLLAMKTKRTSIGAGIAKLDFGNRTSMLKRTGRVTVALLLGATGCSESHTGESIEPLQAVVVGDEGCATLGPAGGMLQTGDLLVNFPPGALGESQELCVAAEEATGPFSAVTPALEFSPQPALLAPVEVRFPLAGDLRPSVFQENSEVYVARDNERDGGHVVFSLPSLKSVYLGMTCQDCAPARSKVDLLAVVDDSGSMAQEQELLRQALPRMTEALLSGDLDGDGIQDVPAVESLHVAVASTGVSIDAVVPRCSADEDDGAFLNNGCGGEPFVHWDGTSSVEYVHEAMSCRVALGTDGCGFEQPFEAALMGLTPSTSDVEFFGGTGIGDGVNAGFVRDNATLAVLLLTDEDDCSTSDQELFNPTSSVYTSDLNLRCSEYSDEAVFPVARYVDGLLALKERAGDIVFGAITGTPEDSDGLSPAEVLADPRMDEVPDPESPSLLTPVCASENGVAFPGVRNVTLAQDLQGIGAHGVVGSICAGDLGPMMGRFGRAVGASLEGR